MIGTMLWAKPDETKTTAPLAVNPFGVSVAGPPMSGRAGPAVPPFRPERNPNLGLSEAEQSVLPCRAALPARSTALTAVPPPTAPHSHH